MKAMLLLKQARIRAAPVLKLPSWHVSMHERPCNSSPARFSAFALLLLDSQSAEYIIEPPLVVERVA